MDDSRDGEYSRFPEIEDLIKLCRSLNEHQVRYLLIGGYAVILRGFARTTKDVDLLVDASTENVGKIKTALAYLPDNAVSQVENDELGQVAVIRVADEFVIDLMAKACGIDYQAAVQEREYLKLGDVQVPIPSVPMLIRMKATDRPGDALDVEFLKTLLKKEKERAAVAPQTGWRCFKKLFF